MLSSRPVKSDSYLGFCVRSWSLVIVSGPILVRLRYAGGDERLNVAETPGSRGRAVQEPQHVLGKGLRVQEVGHVLLPGQDRDETLRQLDGLPPFRPAGTGSLLLDVVALGLDCVEVSNRLLKQHVAATPDARLGWRYRRSPRPFVFSNEPVERLQLLTGRLHRALAAAGTGS